LLTILLPGSFNPPTLGHLKLIERASRLCQHLYVAVGQNIEKPERLLSVEETILLLQKETSSIKNITIKSFTGLVVDCAREIGATVLLKGIRDFEDLNYEMQQAEMNRQLTGIETIFLAAHPETREVRSSLIRELIAHGAPLTKFLPKSIAEAIKKG
jgi:pantetheine-phosphate adenylyltransferase